VGSFDNPKKQPWQLNTASMNVAPPVALIDVEFVCKAKVKRKVTVTYEVK
jgi:hypothetical protein